MLAHLAHPTRYSKLHFEFELANLYSDLNFATINQ